MKTKQPFIKKERAFTALRKYGWIYTLVVAFGGIWFPKLGLTVPLIILGLTLSSLFNGRYWCGNICAHGSLFDVLLLPHSRNKAFPRVLTRPITAGAVFVLFGVNMTRRLMAAGSLMGTDSFWDQLGMVFVMTYLMVTILGSAMGIFFAPRTWCTFCPMGTIQKLMHGVGTKTGINRKTQRVLTPEADQCKACGLCSKACPAQLSPHEAFKNNEQFTHPDCIKCSTCVYTCPTKILSYDQVKPDLELDSSIVTNANNTEGEITEKEHKKAG